MGKWSDSGKEGEDGVITLLLRALYEVELKKSTDDVGIVNKVKSEEVTSQLLQTVLTTTYRRNETITKWSFYYSSDKEGYKWRNNSYCERCLNKKRYSFLNVSSRFRTISV